MRITRSNNKVGTRFGLRPSIFVLICLSLFLFVYSSPLKWADKGSGSLCFADTKESNGDEKSSLVTKAPKNTVIIYVTSWCPACSMAINYLKEKKIPFTVKDVEKNPAYFKEMVNKIGGNRGVPVLDINGKAYLGFHPSMVENLIP